MNLGKNKIDDLGNPWVFAKLLYSPCSSYENGVLTINGSLTNLSVLEEMESAYKVGVSLLSFLNGDKNGFEFSLDFFNPNMLRSLNYDLEKARDGLFYFISISHEDVIKKSAYLINGGRIFAGSYTAKYQRWLNDANAGHRARIDEDGFVILKKREMSLKDTLSSMVEKLTDEGEFQLNIPFSRADSVRQQLWLLGIKCVTITGDDKKIIVRKRERLSDLIEAARLALRSQTEHEVTADLSPTYIYQHLRKTKSDLDLKFSGGKYFLVYKKSTESSVGYVCDYVNQVVDGRQEEVKIPLEDVAQAEKIRKVISRRYFRMISTKVIFGEDGHFLKIWKKSKP
jgi:hypothetical protein